MIRAMSFRYSLIKGSKYVYSLSLSPPPPHFSFPFSHLHSHTCVPNSDPFLKVTRWLQQQRPLHPLLFPSRAKESLLPLGRLSKFS